jgi:patatin-like phospholipase/acyl hydrolase
VGSLPAKFKTYNIGDDFKDCKIWEIARATSTTTTFFKSISCGHQSIEFIDAGFGHNNPSEVLLSEVRHNFLGDHYDCILSIGTGLGGVITVNNKRRSILETLKKIASHADAAHRRLERSLPHAIYFSFNVTRGLDDVSLSDWKQSSKSSAHTANYLAEKQVEEAIERCAKILGTG